MCFKNFIESIIPDGTMVKRNATINVEEQTGKLPPFKVYDIFGNKILGIINY